MRCIKCRGQAVIELRRHHSAFCKPHYLEFFHNQVERAIRRQRMLTPDDRVLVGVSGGKDSLALWDILLQMGHDATGLHIHLGIGDYSDRSGEKTVAFAERRGAPLIQIDLAQAYGMTVPDLSRALRRVPCSGCGLSKRYILNKEAHERGFTVVATGHNLDDEAATLLGNTLHWQVGYLARQSPVLPATTEKLVKRVKPLYTLTEREIAAYALLQRIDYIQEECPNAVGARSILYKEALDRIEVQSPGAKHQFVLGFLDKVKPMMQEAQDEFELRDCALCGQPTTAEVCAFCRTWQQAHRKARERRERQGRQPATPQRQGI